MRIALCIFRYFPYGGLQKDFLRVAEVCAARGHGVVCFCGDDSSEMPLFCGNACIEWRVLALSGMTNHARAKSFERQVARIRAAEKFDCIVGFNRMGGLDFYFAGDICLADALSRKKGGAWKWFLPRYRTFLNLERAVFSPESKTRILALVEAQKSIYRRWYGTPESRFEIIPAGFDTRCGNVGNPRGVRSRLRGELGGGLSDSDFAVALIGSDFKRKGAERAVRAVAALPDELRERTKLFLVGDAPSGKYLRIAAAAGIGDRVFALGGRHDVPELMCAMDLLVHPAESEAGGSVLLEAARSGLPVICTDACGFSGQIEAWEGGKVLRTPFSQVEFNAELVLAASGFARDGRAFPHRLNLQDSRRAKAIVELLEKKCGDRGAGN